MNFEAVHLLNSADNVAEAAARLWPARPLVPTAHPCTRLLAAGSGSALNSRFGERKPKIP